MPVNSLAQSYDPLLERIEAEIAARKAAMSGRDDAEALRLESSLSAFVEAAWPHIDPAPYMSNWAVSGLCDHLQAVAEGRIRRLIINFPPRSSKTRVTSVCFPAWIWARRWRSVVSGPTVRFIGASYEHGLSVEHATLARRLIESPWYQNLWGHRFHMLEDQNKKKNYGNSAGGARVTASVTGGIIGKGANIAILDDPHNINVESEADRARVLSFFQELSSTRLNQPKQAAVILVMQRLHEDDCTGKILDGPDADRWTHYMCPMRFEAARCCQTVLGEDENGEPIVWTDPRGCDDDGEPLVTYANGAPEPRDEEAAVILAEREGALMWPERFDEESVHDLEVSLGPYLASGRLQQSPEPKGAQLFNPDWWQVWEPPDGKFPMLDYVVASLDGAFTADQLNDPSALTIWGVFWHPQLMVERVMLLAAWEEHLKLHGSDTERLPEERLMPGDGSQLIGVKNAHYQQRVSGSWGLVEKVRQSCERYKVDALLIENAASGRTVADELSRLYGGDSFVVHLVKVRGDKVARAKSAQPMFAQKMVWAPNRAWADKVIRQMAQFPAAKHDDLTDSVTQAINWLRSIGKLRTDEERRASQAAMAKNYIQRRVVVFTDRRYQVVEIAHPVAA
jgi:predicted phage terminase large subunit-like protein